jgi:SPP1 family predicted phage head-tail adaptor
MASKFSRGRLRHRIDIEERIETQDTAGEIMYVWSPVYKNVPAEISPLSAREFVAAQAVQSSVSTKIVIPYKRGIVAKQRAVHRPIGGEVSYYNIAKPIRDPDTGLEWLTLLASDGVNDG